MNTFQGWILSLSDGNQILETPPIEGERTSWQKAIAYLKESGLKPTALSLIWNGIKVSAMPKAEGYFQGYEARITLYGKRETRTSRGIGTVVGDKLFITWITPEGAIEQNVRSLESSKVHTTLRD